MRNILLNDSNTHDLISWYYSPASHSFAVQEKDAPGGDVSTNNGLTTEAVPANGNIDVSATEGAVGGAEGVLQKELVRIANQLFMQSIYLPSILHYGKVFGKWYGTFSFFIVLTVVVYLHCQYQAIAI